MTPSRPLSGESEAIAAAQRSIRRLSLISAAIVAVFVGGGGFWAVTAPLAGAVIAAGTVVVESNVKTVQHPNGGIIGEIRVREGVHVTEGDLVMRLDDTLTRANLQLVLKQLIEARAREARLEAERDGRDVVFPAEIAGFQANEDMRRAVDGEATLFHARRAAREGQQRQLRERIDQIREEIGGVMAQEAARRRQVDLIGRELADMSDLFRRNLVPRTRMVELEREAARLSGDVGQFIAERARAQGRITETELQIIQVDQELRREVSAELREVQARIGELVERRVAAEDQLRRIDIRAPQTGFVHQLQHHTVGGVVQGGQALMQIVPGDDLLVFEMRIQTHDIDQVAVGQPVFVRLTAFPHGVTPELRGVMTRVSADAQRDPNSPAPFFVGRARLDAGELAKLGDRKLVPGMPADVFVHTGDRTAMAYLMKPLSDQIRRAFREN